MSYPPTDWRSKREPPITAANIDSHLHRVPESQRPLLRAAFDSGLRRISAKLFFGIASGKLQVVGLFRPDVSKPDAYISYTGNSISTAYPTRDFWMADDLLFGTVTVTRPPPLTFSKRKTPCHHPE